MPPQHGIDYRVAKDRAPASVGGIENTRVPSAFFECTPVLLEVLHQLAACHDGTFIGTRIPPGIFSVNIAFRSFAFGFGVGKRSPSSR